MTSAPQQLHAATPHVTINECTIVAVAFAMYHKHICQISKMPKLDSFLTFLNQSGGGILFVQSMVWYIFVWYGIVWYIFVKYGVSLYGMVWYGLSLYGMAYLCMVWYLFGWYGLVSLCMVWYDISLYGMVYLCRVWYIFVWNGISL